jgi:TfoX/Sxy family transcriptional regulator of competence genes
MPMKWRKSPEALVQKFSEIVPQDRRVEHRKMFGYPAAFVAGNLFMGLHQESLILRLSDEDRASFQRIKGASVFEPMPGRPMREYVVVPSAMVDRGTSLAGWIRRSLDYAASIPPKRAGRSKSPAGSLGAKRGSTKAKRRR